MSNYSSDSEYYDCSNDADYCNDQYVYSSDSDYYEDHYDIKYPNPIEIDLEVTLGYVINEDTFDDYKYEEICDSKKDCSEVINKLNKIKDEMNVKLGLLLASFEKTNDKIIQNNKLLTSLCYEMDKLMKEYYGVNYCVDKSLTKQSIIKSLDECKVECRKTQNENSKLLKLFNKDKKAMRILVDKLEKIEHLIDYLIELKNNFVDKKNNKNKKTSKSLSKRKVKKSNKNNYNLRNTKLY